MTAEATTTTAALARRNVLTVEGHQISYLEWGQAGHQPVILMHDFMNAALSWEWVGVALSQGYHVFAPDAICRGHSDWVNMPWGPAEMGGNLAETRMGSLIATIQALIDTQHLDKVVLVGGSTGGSAAGLYGALHPERVRAIIVDDGSVLPPDLLPPPEQLDAFGSIADGERRFDSVEEALASLGPASTTTNDPRSLDADWLKRRAEELFVEEPDGKWVVRPARPADARAASLRGIPSADVPELKAITVPTLVFYNTTRSHWSEEKVEELKGINPEWVRVATVPGEKPAESIMIVQTAPRTWLLSVLAFLAELDG